MENCKVYEREFSRRIGNRQREFVPSERDSSRAASGNECFQAETLEIHRRSLRSTWTTRDRRAVRSVALGFLCRIPSRVLFPHLIGAVNALRKEALIKRGRDATTPPCAAAAIGPDNAALLCLPVLNAPGAPRSRRRTEGRGAQPEVQTGFGRETPSFSPPPRLVGRAPLADPRPLILFLTRRSAESISLGASSRLILRVLYLGEKSMSTDMLTRVQTWRARKEARGRRGGLEVGLLVCSVGFRRVSAGKREFAREKRNAHLGMHV